MQNELYIVADAIKALRESRGLTQEQLAEKADISVSHLAKIETHGVWCRSLQMCYERGTFAGDITKDTGYAI